MNIFGEKKQKGGAQRPNIAKDTTASTNHFYGLYGLSEGEVYGLVDGGKSIKLDGTPLINDNGQPNFEDVSWEFRSGTIDQPHISGFASVENEQNIGVELRHNRPFTKAIDNAQLSAVVVRLGWNALREQKENGDIEGYRIDYAIDLQTDGGAWQTVLNTTINDKASQGYQRSHRIDLPKARRGWTLRVRRITPNRDSELISDTMNVVALTEVIDAKLRYPCTSVLALKFNAETFGNIPKLAVRMRGMIIQVPSNYNPDTRAYTGLWDGTFKMAYSNNPAWVFYDLCTHRRYGLGERLAGKVDKWSLYQLGQYCDELVDDGKGGKEPRFTVNVYIQKADDAYHILQSLASVFRALSYWDGTQIIVDADTPKEPVYTFTNANVVDGSFSYAGTQARNRHSIVKVAYDDPDNDYKTDYVFVREDYATAKYGTNTLEINAFGCTSRGQAQRVGAWALKSEQLETETVTFKTGLDGFIPKVGEVINIMDNHRAGRGQAGRIIAVKGTVVTLDRTAGKVGDTLIVHDATATITAIKGNNLTLNKAVGQVGQVWAIQSTDLMPRQYRVMSISQDDSVTFSFSALQYEPQKFTASDTVKVAPRPVSVIKAHVLSTPQNITLTASTRTAQGQSVTALNINWSQVVGAVGYVVEWRKDDGAWQVMSKIASQGVDIDGVYAGNYQARVRAVDAFGNESQVGSSIITQIAGKIGRPPKLARLIVKGLLFGMGLDWVFNAGSEDTNFTEIQVSPDGRSNIATLGTFAYPTNKHEITGLQGGLTQFYRGRIVDKLGNTSDWTAWVRGTTSTDADKVLDILSGQINQSHLDQTLRTPIAKIGTLETAVNSVNAQLPTLNGKATNLQNELNTAKNTLQTAVSNITTERNRINTAIRDITALQTANNAKMQELANLTQAVGGHTSSIRELGVTTGDLSQKYTQLKTASDTANVEITAIKQTQNGQATNINRLNSEITNKATTSSLEALRQTSTDAHNANARAIDALSSTVQSSLSSKLDASAIQNYYTKAETDSAVTGKINEFNASLIIGGVNVLPNSHVEKTSASEHLYYAVLPALKEFYLGNPVVTISFDLSVPIAGDVRIYSSNNSGVYFMASVTVTEANAFKRYSVTVNPVRHSATPDNPNGTLEFYGTYGTKRIPTVKNVKIESGNKATAWTPALSDVDGKVNANAQAISAINSNVSNLNNTLTSQSQQLTQLRNSLTATNVNVSTKADTTALNTLDSRVTQQGESITSQSSKIAQLENSLNTVNQSLSTKATASTLDSLDSKVTTLNNTVTSQGQAITQLNNTLNATNTNVSKKADSTALTALDNRVTQQGNNIASQASQITQLNSNLTTMQGQALDAVKMAGMISNGKLLHADVNFKQGSNGVSVYNNAGGGAVIHERIAKRSNNPTSSTHEIRITRKANMASAPALGGFYQNIQSAPNKTFVVKYLICLPVGYNLNVASNATGDNRTDKFIGSTAGTGKYETYLRFIQCGDTGTFSTSGHVYVSGVAPATQDLVWYLAQIECYEVTDYQSVDGTVQAFMSSATSSLNTLNNNQSTQATQLSQLTANVSTTQQTANTANGKADTATTKADNAQRTANDAVSHANTANSAITAEQRARADADSSLASQITALDTAYKSADNNLTARLAREETARASGDNANAQAIRTLESTVNGIGGRVGTSESKIATLERTTSDLNGAIATAQSQLNARFDNLSVGGRNLLKHTQRLDQHWRFASGGQGNSMTISDGVARLTGVGSTWKHLGYDINKPTAQAWLKDGTTFTLSIYAKKISGNPRLSVALRKGITGGFKDDLVGKSFDLSSDWQKLVVSGTITPDDLQYLFARFEFWGDGVIELKKPKLEYGNMATDWTPAPEDVNVDLSPYATTASLDELRQAQATKDTATAQKLSQLESGLNGKANATALDSLTTKVNQVDGKLTAETAKIATLQTTVGGHTASIQQHAQSLNGLSAQWTLKVQSGNIVSGIGLASSNGVSDFAVRADKFYVAPPTGTTKSPLFSVLTTPTTLNGVAVPAGTYLSDAFIQNGSINNAKIANGAINNAKIANASIDTAKIKDGSINNAKIANGAITSAKIGHAQIDTLQIADGAVVVPRARFLENAGSITLGQKKTLIELSIEAIAGMAVVINVRLKPTGIIVQRNGIWRSNSPQYALIAILSKNGQEIKRDNLVNNNDGSILGDFILFGYVDVAHNGVNNYKLELHFAHHWDNAYIDTSATIADASLSLMLVKK